MNIWIMRHGEAGFNAQTDKERTLTSSGETMAFKQGQWLGKYLLEQRVTLDKVIVSPYLRTLQTLSCLEKGLQAVNFSQSFANISEEWEGITPYGDSDNVVDYLRFLREEGAQNVLIISHLPLVFDLVQALTNYKESVNFYPAVIAEIEWKIDKGRLVVAEYP
ncbi:phosphohistidine phosphatase SixA [Pasteurellaceae bacterium LFhippo2]|nr:phosphohistidine phosphatase SixA [Pasteurellaceae bacterium LFhippo2]